MNKSGKLFAGKTILITGVCGTIGHEILRSLINMKDGKPGKLVGLDQDETGLFFLSELYSDQSSVTFRLGNIRNLSLLIEAIRGVDIIFHVAALKHVGLCESSPSEAVASNITAVENIIHAAKAANVGAVIFTSSDKAVNPTSVMGTTKLMAERLFTAATQTSNVSGPLFASARFGNVLGSNGSVIPLFHRQISLGGPVTLTDPNVTRFVMSAGQASQLVLDCAAIAKGGEVFVTKMPVIRIADLAETMIEELAPRYGYKKSDVQIKLIGLRPGEKKHEELMSLEETRRSIELENYFAILPAFRGMYRNTDYNYAGKKSKQVIDPYSSDEQTPIGKSKLRELLLNSGLLDVNGNQFNDQPVEPYWPGGSTSS